MTDSVAINNKFALDMKMGPVFQTTVTPLMGGYEDSHLSVARHGNNDDRIEHRHTSSCNFRQHFHKLSGRRRYRCCGVR